MPKQKSRPAKRLADRLGTKGRKAHDKHKADETRLTGSVEELPEGIENGVARLTMCKFDDFSTGDLKGKPYFMAMGVVVEPEEYAGRHTSLSPEPLCDTPNRRRATLEDHIDKVLNELRKLGVDTDSIDIDDYEEVAAALEGEAPYFRFRTWKGEATEQYPNPRVQHDWRGVIADYNGQPVDEVEDDTEEEEQEEPTGDTGGNDDLIALAELADAGDQDAGAKISAAAEEAGIDSDVVENAESWAAVVEMIESGGEDEEEPEEEEDEEDEEEAYVPEKEDIVMYRPPRARKAVECEVTAVFAKKETANVKNLDDGKSYKAVPWAKLQAVV